MKKFVFSLLLLMTLKYAYAMPDKIIIFRHGEDVGRESEETLEKKGFDRARMLAKSVSRWGTFHEQGPSAIFSTTFHTTLTASPIARAVNLPLQVINERELFQEWLETGRDLSAEQDTLAEFYPIKGDRSIALGEGERMQILLRELKRPQYDHKLVLICWVHKEMQELVESLGYVHVPSWPEDKFGEKVFNRFWILNLAQDKKDKNGNYLFANSVNNVSQ